MSQVLANILDADALKVIMASGCPGALRAWACIDGQLDPPPLALPKDLDTDMMWSLVWGVPALVRGDQAESGLTLESLDAVGAEYGAEVEDCLAQL